MVNVSLDSAYANFGGCNQNGLTSSAKNCRKFNAETPSV
jgi:hypothetical protein